MYRCANCHEIFDEPDENYFELTRIDGQRIIAKDYNCPFCKSDAIEEVHQCNGCGEYVSEDEWWVDGGLCDECYYEQRGQEDDTVLLNVQNR